MPAIDPEIEDALKEDVEIVYLAAPVAIQRDGDKVTGMTVRKMELGEPDASGRRRPVPIDGSDYDIAVDTVVAAISQEPTGENFEALCPGGGSWVSVDDDWKAVDGVWAGGDVVKLGLVTVAVGHGRKAAIRADAVLRGVEPPRVLPSPPIPKERIKMEVEEVYPSKPKAVAAHRPVDEWLAEPNAEINLGIEKEAFIEEVSRCFSCGQCFGCERCWMYCTPGCFKKADEIVLGEPYYKMKLDTCDGCKKCEDECPCGYMDMA
jgi:Pyruvate/2-oxoacid:ferredoxin oxidoreductase delta subunit